MLDAVLKSVVGRMDDVRWAEEIGVFRQVTQKDDPPAGESCVIARAR